MRSTGLFFCLLFRKNCIKISEEHLGLCQTSMMETFYGNSKRFIAPNYFCKQFHQSLFNFIFWRILHKASSASSFFSAVYRRCHRRCSIKKGVFKQFAKCTRKDLYQSLYFNKDAGLRATTLIKQDYGTGIILWIFQNFYIYIGPPRICYG